jgi:outer membrane protein TolC
VPTGTLTAEALPLSVWDVITRALEHNLGLLLADQDVNRAQSARVKALGELMPNINGRISETRQQINLAAYGFPLPAGIPSIVGPFNLFDARVFLSQTVLDFKALNDKQAETHNVAAAKLDYKNARDIVVLVAVDSYARALAAAARLEAVRAQVRTSETLYTQAQDMKQAGLIAGVDVLRAQVQLDADRHTATTATVAVEKTKLQVARLIGLPLGQNFTLLDQMTSKEIPEMTFEEAVERAYRTRGDYLALVERVHAAEFARQAANGESLPAIRVTANYGDLGVSVADSHGTFAVTGAVDIPIFQGGKARGRLAEADANLRSRRADLEDLKASIYYELRSAMLDLQAGNEQQQVATRARDLAANELTQARDRFAAGVAGNVEVVQAQSAVSRANDQYIEALYNTNLAKGAIVRAVGIAEDTARQLFGGAR